MNVTQKCDFSVLDQKYPFWVNLVQKIKIQLKKSVDAEIWYRDQLEFAKFNGDIHFSALDWKFPFWVNLVQNI